MRWEGGPCCWPGCSPTATSSREVTTGVSSKYLVPLAQPAEPVNNGAAAFVSGLQISVSLVAHPEENTRELWEGRLPKVTTYKLQWDWMFVCVPRHVSYVEILPPTVMVFGAFGGDVGGAP